MKDNGGVLVVIPARGGSKRLPRKNLLPLAGKPLICWSIDAAIEASLDGARIVVSSDDEEILDVARRYEALGVISCKRSPELSTDTTSTANVLVDLIKQQESVGFYPGTILLLQPTSPLRSPCDIKAAFELYGKDGSNNTVATVCEVDHPTSWIGKIGNGLRLEGLDLSRERSQDYQKEYRLNGAVYVMDAAHLVSSGSIFTEIKLASIMPRSRSLDIDEYIDFKICEFLISEG